MTKQCIFLPVLGSSRQPWISSCSRKCLSQKSLLRRSHLRRQSTMRRAGLRLFCSWHRYGADIRTWAKLRWGTVGVLCRVHPIFGPFRPLGGVVLQPLEWKPSGPACIQLEVKNLHCGRARIVSAALGSFILTQQAGAHFKHVFLARIATVFVSLPNCFAPCWFPLSLPSSRVCTTWHARSTRRQGTGSRP